jgi:predicted AAA+ superfamily ATPase
MAGKPPRCGGFTSMEFISSPRARGLSSRIEAALADTPAIFLGGARQVGKSTLVSSLVSNERYISFDDLTSLSAARHDPEGFLSTLGEGRRIVIDEVQRVPDFLIAIKASIDRNRKPGRFILTGSANILTLPKVSETLAGRVEILHLYPFVHCELANAPSPLAHILNGTIPQHQEYLTRERIIERAKVGGFPDVVTRVSSARRRAWFSSYITTLISREVRTIIQIGDDAAILRILKILAARAGGPRNIDAMAHDSGIPSSTLRRYLSALETIYLITEIPAWFVNIDKRITKQPKLLFVDSGLYNYLVGEKIDPGILLETYVGCELQRLLSMHDEPMTLHHYRTTRGAEVDWVIERADGSIVGCEVKAAAGLSVNDLRGLRDLRKASGDRFAHGVIFYTGERVVRFESDLIALPIGML